MHLTLFANICLCLASAHNSGLIHDITPQNLDFDLGEEFVRDALSGSLKQSLDFIDKAETLPSCGKIATSALLHSCSALEGSIDHEDDRLQPGSDLLIDEESDIYAIRLAVCELAGADRSPPYECRSLVPAARSRLTTVKGWLFRSGATKPRIVHEYYDSVTKAGLKRCLAALYSETNAWVSYSNGKQNAVVMCRAMQSAVERDESRHIAKILTQVAAKTGASLYEASEQINEQVSEIRQQFHELRTAMPKFQADVAAFDADIQQKVQVYWTEFDRAQGGLKSLTESIDHAHLGMKEARTHLDVVLSAHLPELGKALAIASQQVKDSSDKAAAATDLVAYTLQKIQDDATKELEAMGYSLAAINVMVPELNDILDTTVNHAMELQDIVFTQRLELNAAYNETMVEVRTLQHSIQNATETFKGLQKGIDRFVDAVRWVEERTGPLLAVIGLLWRETILYGAGLAGALVSACCFVLAGLGWRRSVIAGLLVFAGAVYLFYKFERQLHSHNTAFVDTAPRQFPSIGWFPATSPICAAGIVVTMLAIRKYFTPPSRRQYAPGDPYDPSSPPYDSQTWLTTWQEGMPIAFGGGDGDCVGDGNSVSLPTKSEA